MSNRLGGHDAVEAVWIYLVNSEPQRINVE